MGLYRNSCINYYIEVDWDNSSWDALNISGLKISLKDCICIKTCWNHSWKNSISRYINYALNNSYYNYCWEIGIENSLSWKNSSCSDLGVKNCWSYKNSISGKNSICW